MVMQSAVADSVSAADVGSYAELKRLIKERGLLNRRPLRSLIRLLIIDGMLVLSVVTLLEVHIFWVQCLNALFLAFVSVQFGFNGHDAGHRQSFDSTRSNDLVGLLHGNLGIGMSFSWWMDKHNRHHSRPNEIDSDPDLDIPVLTFTSEEAKQKHGIARFIAAHQALLFFPVLTLVALELQLNSVRFLLGGKTRHLKMETILLLLHYLGYFGILLIALPVWQALIFVLIQKAVMGLYLGSVFAPNHKGMLLTEHNCRMDFLRRQILTARNVYAHPLIDVWYGGLNYQIEHHLFPSMPRGNLARAQSIIRTYCHEHDIPYHETGIVQSYSEILTFLHDIGAPLRTVAA
ncbi:MAG: fatty acid desaturase family protein [Ktedonobacterales bacterium]